MTPITLDTIFQQIGYLTELVIGNQDDISGIKNDLSELKTDVSELKTDVSELKTDVSVLKTDVSELKTDVHSLKLEMSEVRTELSHKADKTDLDDLRDEMHNEFRFFRKNIQEDISLFSHILLEHDKRILTLENSPA